MAKTANKPAVPADQPQAGAVIAPGSSESQAPAAPAAAPQPATSAPSTAQAAEPETALPPAEPVSSDDAPELPAADPEISEPPVVSEDLLASDDGQTITWTASEFIAHHKSAGWYALLGLGTIVLAAVVYLLMKDPVSTGVVIIVGLLLGVYAGHQPRQLEYSLNGQGLSIGERHYAYGEFKFFSVIEEGAFPGITFMPLQRFSAPITIYYPLEDEDGIFAIIASHLPMEEHHADALDKLLNRIRF